MYIYHFYIRYMYIIIDDDNKEKLVNNIIEGVYSTHT